MSSDALFQSGMGPVELDAPRTEVVSITPLAGACRTIFRLVFTRTRLTGIALLRTAVRQRGGLQKRLVPRRMAITIPS